MSLPDLTALRRATLLAVVCGQLAAAAAGVLPAPLLLLAVAVTAAGAALAARAPAARAVRLRQAATALVLVLALLAAARGPGGEAGLRGLLGPLLVGVVAVQALTWSTRRDVQTGVVAAVGLLVLGASFAPDVLVGLPLLLGWWAVLAAVVLAVRAAATEGADVVVAGGRARTGLVGAGALAAVLGLVAFLLVPVPQDAGLQSRLAAAAGAVPGAGSGRAAPGAYTGDRVDLRNRGDLTDTPLLEVPSDSPALWRSGVYRDWDGTSWSVDRQERRVPGPPFLVAPAEGPVRTDRVEVRRAVGPVWAPGPVVSVRMGGRVALVDDLGSVRGATAPGYEVTSRVVAPTDAALRIAAGADVDDPSWTALPPGLPARVTELGRRLAAGAPSRIDAVRAVERHLAANARYDLDSPVPGPGEDAVDRFLFVDRVGFCEQFAAAEVLLLRSAGIPARFVTGLAYGVDTGPGRRTFRQLDLHAWVEVWHPGVGWVASDPTPPSTQLASASLRVRLVAELTVALRRADDVPGGRPALAAGLLGLTGVVAAVLVLRRRTVPAAAPSPVVRADGRPALQAFLRFDRRLGARRRQPAESLAELRVRLDVPDDVRTALEVVEAECYAPVPPTAAQATAVLDRA